MNIVLTTLRKTFLLLLLLCVTGHVAQSQNRTVGVLFNSQVSFDGYTLMAPMSAKTTYLIDNCGHEIHRWESNYNPGLACYLLDDGSILRTARINSTFNSGGSGGRIEIINWDGELVWGWNYSSSEHQQHHDVEELPNGNILVLAWEKITRDSAVAAGRDPSTLGPNSIWPEHIIEVKPVGNNDAEIVWEWHATDHLIQEYDQGKSNYGVVSEHPELIDFNYESADGFLSGADWIHLNAIDYNPELDQIMVSSRNMSEIWIIDHSTTTEEAASHAGGNSGMGGDIIYRWGNPEAYSRGTQNDRMFFGQHDAHWIEQGLPDAGKIIVFNNGYNRPGRDFSSVDIIEPVLISGGTAYMLQGNGQYAPDSLYWTFGGDSDFEFFANNISGASQLPNGNILICNGTEGKFTEINKYGDPVWQYVNPISIGNPTSQGDPPFSNNVFKIDRYAPDFPAFDGRELMPGALLEANPLPEECVLYQDTSTSVLAVALPEGIHLLENPVQMEIQLSNPDGLELQVGLYNLQGKLLLNLISSDFKINIPVGELPDGFIIANVRVMQTGAYGAFRVVKIQ